MAVEWLSCAIVDAKRVMALQLSSGSVGVDRRLLCKRVTNAMLVTRWWLLFLCTEPVAQTEKHVYIFLKTAPHFFWTTGPDSENNISHFTITKFFFVYLENKEKYNRSPYCFLLNIGLLLKLPHKIILVWKKKEKRNWESVMSLRYTVTAREEHGKKRLWNDRGAKIKA